MLFHYLEWGKGICSFALDATIAIVKLYFSGLLYNCESKLGPKNR